VFDQPGIFHARRRFEKLSETDLQQQLWFIRASLATVAVGRDHMQWSTPDVREHWGTANALNPLVAAQAIGDHLESLALDGEEGVSWVGLTLTAKNHWSLVPLGFDLYSGLPGVALFLAYLGAISEEKRYTKLARTIVKVILRHLKEYRVPALSIGAFAGLSGIIYLLTHLGVLWDEPQLLHEANRSAEGLNSLIKYDRKFDITGGAAGCILSLSALYRVSPTEHTLATVIQCGDHLLKSAQPVEKGIAWPPYSPAKGPLTGLAHGAAGIGWALLEAAGLSGEMRFQEAALDAFKYEESLFSTERKNWPDLREADERSHTTQESPDTFQVGWCHGAPGIALTRIRSLRYLDNTRIRADIDAGLHTTLNQGFGGNHSLCHGDLGNLELLLQASELVDGARWRPHVSRVGAAILERIQENGWQCGVPLAVESPGLMTGLAGIGYGLLRLAEPLRVPAVLVLAPPVGACGNFEIRPNR
jgi:type 2 lantibiotic biosynthesis protein LanM